MAILLPEPLAALDFETTQSPTGLRAVEIGIAVISNGRVVDSFESLVNPSCPVDPFSRSIHGICDADLAEAPSLPEVWDQAYSLLHNYTVSAHNAQFDSRVLNGEIARLNLRTPAVRWWCSLRLARKLLPDLSSHKLSALTQALELGARSQHRAGQDAAFAAGLLLTLARAAEKSGWTTEEFAEAALFSRASQLAAADDVSPCAHRSSQNDGAVRDLIELCSVVVADGVISHEEATYVLMWLERNGNARSVWPGNVLFSRLERMLADGCFDDSEEKELLGILRDLTGDKHEEDASRSLPLTVPYPEIIIPKQLFVLTGTFVTGPRSHCMELIKRLGGVPQNAVTKKTNYLVIGELGSENWMHSTYGRKIEAAVTLRESGHAVAIVSEQHWAKACGLAV
jgi:DNA polymerase III epsilon subunit-like protein